MHRPFRSFDRLFLFAPMFMLAAAVVLAGAVPSIAHADERIHVISLISEDAIVLESDGHFGIVDSGEDSFWPDGSDPRYPWRDGITTGRGSEDEVLGYLRSLGVNEDNFDFYIGTHPHSDHISMADQVIREFKPKRVYIKPYKDEYVTEPDRLWDNLFIYDRMIAAAQETGATLIQHFDEGAPVSPDQTSEDVVARTTGNPVFMLGNMRITIMNTSEDYEEHPVYDANCFSLGVKAEANGHSAFLAGDINNVTRVDQDPEKEPGLEDELAAELGHVDVLKVGHHGLYRSNTWNYLETLSPDFAIQTQRRRNMYWPTMQHLFELGTKYYPTDDAIAAGVPAIVVTMGDEVSINERPTATVGRIEGSSLLHARIGDAAAAATGWYWYDGARYFFDNADVCATGWTKVGDDWRYFDESTGVERIGWQKLAWNQSTAWYHFDADGVMDTGWHKIDGRWYYLAPSGRMKTGWLEDEGYWYHLASSGAMQTGWYKDGSEWYFLRSSGRMATGWQEVEGNNVTNWYFFGESGRYLTGWIKSGGEWYHLAVDGIMDTGWLKEGRNWYFLTSSGAMKTGWLDRNGTWYHLRESGAMDTGWIKLDGLWYYLYDDGSMAFSTWIGSWHVGSDGAYDMTKEEFEKKAAKESAR